MMDIDWHRLFFSDQPYVFFIEILIRTPLMFLAVVLTLRLTGKRGIQQLSIFEMVMIITLGSAAGDAMFYEDVGLLHALAVLFLVLVFYRLIILLIANSEKAEKILEGEPRYLVREGMVCLTEIHGNEMGVEEFFGELRGYNVEHLGQLRYVIIEDTGKLSIFYYSDAQTRPGLPILPDDYAKRSHRIDHAGCFACARCGHIESLEITDFSRCTRCANKEWVAAISTLRIT